MIVTQSMEAHVAKRHSGKRTITIITTTWTIHWWDGETWIEQTLEPRVEVVASDEESGSTDEAASDAVLETQESPRAPETDQSTATKESKP